MYSPKLDEKLVPVLYRIAQAKGIPMTQLVNSLIADAIRNVQVETKMVCETVPAAKEVYFIADDSSKEAEV